MKRTAWIAIAACMIVGQLCNRSATAGDWHVGIGVGFPAHCHHGYCYDPYWYPPPPRVVYVAPPPVTYVQPAPVQYVVPPAQTAVAPAPSAVASSATIRPNAVPNYQGRGVTIQNPPSTGASVAFVVDSESELVLSPGQAKSLNNKGTYVVEFDRGGDFGTARRTVTEGPWKFVATQNGWDLQRDLGADSGSDIRPVVRRNALPVQR